MEALATADIVILAGTAVFALFGLFWGFSGALAFLAGSVMGALGGRLAWTAAMEYGQTGWSRALVALVAAILVFGIVRWAVKKIVGGLLRQPADAVFGFLVSGVTGLFLALAAVYAVNLTGFFDVQSRLVTYAAGFVEAQR